MEHILLIEDNLPDVVLIQSYLREAPFLHRLYKAKSLQEGLDTIRHHPIDIVLLDLALDDTAGFNTLRMFLQEVPALPVLVLTGTSNEVLGMQIIHAGAQDYLVKGNFDGKQLLRAIRHSTKRFAAQTELHQKLSDTQRREKRYEHLHRLVKLGYWEMDLLDNSMHWSNELYELLGYHPRSFEPRLSDYLRTVHPEDRDVVKDFFQATMHQSKPLQIEHRAVINNQKMHHYCLQAQVVAEERSDRLILIGSLQDITHWKSDIYTSASDKKLSGAPMAKNGKSSEVDSTTTNGTRLSIQMLIVEHQTIVQIALKRMLQTGLPHISMDFAADVPDGIQKLTEKDYDLVLVDVQLPTTEPAKIVSALKETKNVALLAMASEFSKQDKTDLHRLGVGAFLTKPLQREALLESVQVLLKSA
jgi:PAS domain S-box-containing protein